MSDSRFVFNEKTKQHVSIDLDLYIEIEGTDVGGGIRFKVVWKGYPMLLRAKQNFITDTEVTWTITSLATADSSGQWYGFKSALQMFQVVEIFKEFLSGYSSWPAEEKIVVADVKLADHVKEQLVKVISES